AANPQLLIEDYDLALQTSKQASDAKQQGLRKIQGALRMSANVLSEDPNQLAGHLLGRLLSAAEPEIQSLLKQTKGWKRTPWIRPLAPILQAPGEALLRTLEGHAAGINEIVITPDGTKIVSASDDHTLKVWDLQTGNLLLTLTGHTGIVKAVAVAPNGSYLISGAWDHTLRVWDLQTGQETQQFHENTGVVTAIAIAPDGRRFVAAAGIGTESDSSDADRLKLWNVDNGTEITSLCGHTGPVDSVTITPDGQYVISGAGSTLMQPSDETIRIWELETGREVGLLTGHTGPIKALAVSPDGQHLISAGGGRHTEGFGQTFNNVVIIWNLDQRTQLHSLRGHLEQSIDAVAVTPDGKFLISGASVIKVWNLQTGAEVASLPETEGIKGIAVTPDCRYLVTGSNNGTLKIFDFSILLEQAQLYRNSPFFSSQELQKNAQPNNIGAVTPDRQTATPHTARVNAISITPNGQFAVTASDDGTLNIWNLHNQALCLTLRGQVGSIRAMVALPDNHRIIFAAEDMTLRVWDIQEGREVLQLENLVRLFPTLAVSHNGRWLVSASTSRKVAGLLRIWDLENGREHLTIDVDPVFPIDKVVVTPNGQQVIAGLMIQDKLYQWDLETGVELAVFQSSDRFETALAITPDGERLITATRENGALTLWDLATGIEVAQLDNPGANLFMGKLVVTPNSRYLLITAALSDQEAVSHTLKVWDLNKKQIICQFRSDSALTACAVAADGVSLVLGNADGKVMFLKVEGLKT
ncbi:MAG: WD40 repeat domain-containing protein, partial [Cyanobacteria bacterium P01_D01_bin.56]